MDFEKELEQVAQQYRDEGYVVRTRPDTGHLPAFAAGFPVDVLATRADGAVLVKVKRDRADLEADPDVSRQAEITNRQRGWRYDLVILTEDDPLRRLTRGSREPSNEEIDELLASAERMIQAGELRAACVFGWAALEAAMRQVARDAELYTPKTTPAELLGTLYGHGFLNREEFDRLRQGFRVRTEVVHGLIPPAIDPALVRAVLASTRRLLTGNREAQPAAT